MFSQDCLWNSTASIKACLGMREGYHGHSASNFPAKALEIARYSFFYVSIADTNVRE
jgi:hypothetical protein